MKAALYARVSSEKQAEKDLSIPSQLDAMREFASKNGWEIYREFVDEAESARTDKRPAFQEMISLSKQKIPPFQMILVWKYNRFARNRTDSGFYKAQLKKLGISVVSLNEKIDDSPGGFMWEGMIELMDEYYSINLAQDTKRGMKKNASNGSTNGGNVPFGYKLVVDEITKEKTYVPVELEVPIVEKIVKYALDGEGTKDIARFLNEQKHTTRSGRPWTKNHISYILRNEIYTGTLVWNRHSKSTGVTRANTPDQIIRVCNHHPALINQENFNKIQSLLDERRREISNPWELSSDYLLSSLLRCGKCGSKMTGCRAKSGRYAYYACSRYQRSGKTTCDQKMRNSRKLETFVLNAILDRILPDENLSRLADQINNELKENQNQNLKDLTHLNQELMAVDSKLNKYFQIIDNGDMRFETLGDKINSLNASKKALLERKKELEYKGADQVTLSLSSPGLKHYLQHLRENLMGKNVQQQKRFIRRFITRITISGENVEIAYIHPLQQKPLKKQREPLISGVPSTSMNGSPGWTRTNNPAINSRMLHH
jgi:site-specific DNA recombinase